MTTVLVRAQVRRRRRHDGIDELVRRSAGDLTASELLLLAALCAGAALLAGGLGGGAALAACGLVVTGYLVVRASRAPGRTLPLRPTPLAGLARGTAGRPAPRWAPAVDPGDPGAVGLAPRAR